MSFSKQIIALCLYILFFIPISKAQENKVDYFDITEISKKIDSLLQNYDKNEPGIAIGVVKDNNLVINKQVGLANLEHRIPITEKTSFHVASVSKQFTAFAILQLEDQNLLSLDDDVRKYIPEMHEFEKKITIRELS